MSRRQLVRIAICLLVSAALFSAEGAEPARQTPAPEAAAPGAERFFDNPALAPVNRGTPSWLNLSGEIRFRFEGRSGLGFAEGNDDRYGLVRTRLNIGVQPARWLNFFVQAQDSRAPGIRDDRASGLFRDPADIRQAWVRFGAGEGRRVAFTAGRQLLSYGDQRLIGALDWTNTSRAFDALKLELQPRKGVRFDLFSASVVQNDPARRINQSLEGNNLHGVYGAVDVTRNLTLEPYVLWKTTPAVVGEDGARGDSDRYTAGARAFAKNVRGWDYNLAFVKQWGRLANDPIDAWAYYLTLGHTFQFKTTPRLFAEYNFASGDEDPADGRIGFFDDLFPTAHLWYGYNDLVGWRNLKNLRLGSEFKPLPGLKLGLDYHFFWLANPNDALYNAGGRATVRPPAGGAADTKVGEELDFTFSIPLSRMILFGGGVGHMFPGPFLKANSGGDGNTFTFLFIAYKL